MQFYLGFHGVKLVYYPLNTIRRFQERKISCQGQSNHLPFIEENVWIVSMSGLAARGLELRTNVLDRNVVARGFRPTQFANCLGGQHCEFLPFKMQ